MSSSASRLILFYGGELQVGPDSVPTYYGGSNRPLRVYGRLTLSELHARILQALCVDGGSHTITLACRYPASGGFVASNIEDDDSCEFLLQEAKQQPIVVYVDIQSSPIRHLVSSDSISLRRDTNLLSSHMNEQYTNPEWDDQHTELIFHRRHISDPSLGHEQRRRSTSDVSAIYAPNRSHFDALHVVGQHDGAGPSHIHTDEGEQESGSMESHRISGSSETSGFDNLVIRAPITGMCDYIREGTIRITNINKESRSPILEQEVKENKAFMCCLHRWNKRMDKSLWKYYGHAFHTFCVHINKGDFLPLIGWETLQRHIEDHENHTISIHHLQMRYFQLVKWRKGEEVVDNSKINRIFSNLLLYRRWDKHLDEFLHMSHWTCMKKPLPSGEERKFLTGIDWLSLQERFHHFNECCPPLSQLKARALFLEEKYRLPPK